ncbi:MAG: hypothetical protein WB988_06345, partial [Candidatus Nitrosopolaris sp.]
LPLMVSNSPSPNGESPVNIFDTSESILISTRFHRSISKGSFSLCFSISTASERGRSYPF